jgi:hypothetical protein
MTAKASSTTANAPKLPAPPEAPPLPESNHTLRFVTADTVVCTEPADAIAGECTGKYARYAPKLQVGDHAWVGEPDDATDGVLPFFRGPNADAKVGYIAAEKLAERPETAEFDKARSAWKAIPAADRSNLVKPGKDELFRFDVSANLARPRSEMIDGIPHPKQPLKLDYIGAPTPVTFTFSECLVSGEPGSWVARHECLLDATCAELQYACTSDYCDELMFVAKPAGNEDVPVLRVVAVADRHGTYACPEFGG